MCLDDELSVRKDLGATQFDVNIHTLYIMKIKLKLIQHQTEMGSREKGKRKQNMVQLMMLQRMVYFSS